MEGGRPLSKGKVGSSVFQFYFNGEDHSLMHHTPCAHLEQVSGNSMHFFPKLNLVLGKEMTCLLLI